VPQESIEFLGYTKRQNGRITQSLGMKLWSNEIIYQFGFFLCKISEVGVAVDFSEM